MTTTVGLRDEILTRLRGRGMNAWRCHVGPALFVGTRLHEGGLCLIEVGGRPLDPQQEGWRDRMLQDGVLYLKAKSVAEVERALFRARAPVMLTPEEIDDAIESLPDNETGAAF